MEKQQKKVKETQQLSQPLTVNESQPTNPEVSNIKKELSVFEKAILANDLVAACTNPKVVELLGSLPNGSKIISIFMNAMEKEVSNIMSPTSEKDEIYNQVKNLSSDVDNIQKNVNDFGKLIASFLNSPLVGVLRALHSRISGQNTQLEEQNSEPQYEILQPTNQSYETGSTRAGRGDNNSFLIR
jgi:hypothetical protein